jgi:hypothetical protein
MATTRNPGKLLLLALIPLALVGCDQPRAHGDANAIIVASDPDLWSRVENVVQETLEPTIQTVTDERTFRVTWQDPNRGEHWGNLRRFRQVLVIGGQDDPWVSEALEKRDASVALSPPQLLQVQNVWARGQQVSILLLPPTGQEEAVQSLSGELQAILDRQYRDFILTRMFVSGRNTALADSLRQNAGFSLEFPNVYRYIANDSVLRFRNDNPSPAELIREVGLTWRSPAPDALPDARALEEWRVAFAAEFYNDPQDLDPNIITFQPLTVAGRSAVEYQSAWRSPPDAWPAGGPFITRAVLCPEQDRLYLMDAWLYAPGRDKYEYMLQLQTILDSFRCE